MSCAFSAGRTDERHPGRHSLRRRQKKSRWPRRHPRFAVMAWTPPYTIWRPSSWAVGAVEHARLARLIAVFRVLRGAMADISHRDNDLRAHTAVGSPSAAAADPPDHRRLTGVRPTRVLMPCSRESRRSRERRTSRGLLVWYARLRTRTRCRVARAPRGAP